jgi:DNA-binding Lrp family transcriptional regulator
MANNINVGAVVSPNVLKTISSSTAIKTFGDQLVNKAKEKVISSALGKVQELKDQIQEIVTLKIKTGIDHSTELKRLEVLLKEKQITQEQYNKAVEKENLAYQAKLRELEQLDAKLKEDLAKILSDPYARIKQKLNFRLLKKGRRKTRNKAERAKARRDLAKKVAKNAAKTLAPILALQLANQFASVLSQRAKLEELVDQVNAYIEQANTPETIAIATNLRNNAVTLINNSINKLTRLQQTINQIQTYIAIFTAIVAVLSAIPIPTAVPPGIGIPVSLITRIVKSLNRAALLIASISVIAAIAVSILENEIAKLNDLIERLKQVNALLDAQSATNLNEQQLADLSNTFLPTGGDFDSYKGFKFAIKEEQTLGAQQAIVVKGNKRRYAVAINRDGVEEIKSDYSFTLDPNDLIDQLKLIIDQRNLQG